MPGWKSPPFTTLRGKIIALRMHNKWRDLRLTMEHRNRHLILELLVLTGLNNHRSILVHDNHFAMDSEAIRMRLDYNGKTTKSIKHVTIKL